MMCALTGMLHAQVTKSCRIEWMQPVTLQGIQKALYFRGAGHDKSLFPLYAEQIPVNASSDYTVTLLNTRYEPLTSAERVLVKAPLPPAPAVESYKVYHHGRASLFVSFVPLRSGPGNTPEKLVSFDLSVVLSPAQAIKAPSPSRVHANSSVLSSGNWYKIGVVKDGVHKISYSFMRSLGMNVASLNPRNIRIYGNGGKMLPEHNMDFRQDDLLENTIEVVGESDGVLDTSDYVLFYGQSPHGWAYNSADGQYHHTTNIYSDTTFYFITADLGTGKRISPLPSLSVASTHSVTTGDEYFFHELERINLLRSGRDWFGEPFDVVSTLDFQFSLPQMDLSSPLYFRSSVVGQSKVSSTFTVNVNGQSLTQLINPSDKDNIFLPVADASLLSELLTLNSTAVTISYTYNRPDAVSAGWLDYFEVNYRRKLAASSGQLLFRDKLSAGAGNIAEFTVTGIVPGLRIWNVTNPGSITSQIYNTSGTTASFRASADSINQYVAFGNAQFEQPFSKGKVPNQNLHGTQSADMVIVSPTVFYSEAVRIADMHTQREGMDVRVVTPQQIYNEFSSGSTDITAIRDFVKMIYDRAQDTTKRPKYLLLVGDGSVDPKKRMSPEENHIPTYQSRFSLEPLNSYTSDNYYGFMDDEEGDWSKNDKVEIGIGRLPVKTPQDARAVADKIISYKGAFGDWRNMVCFVSDDQDADGYNFVRDCEFLAGLVTSSDKRYNVDKIYADAYRQEVTAGGQRYPDVTRDITNRVEKGALIMNYIGHGGELGWAHERILSIPDITGWNNTNYPLFVTATCEFSRFDDPLRTSAGELVLLNPKGGGIALLTTVRVVFESQNMFLNTTFFQNVFVPVNGRMPTLGEVYETTMNEAAKFPNTRNFTLLGDPALTLNYPGVNIGTSSINNVSVTSVPDTLRGLSRVTVKGFVSNGGTSPDAGFNGILYPTVYDKTDSLLTLVNDPDAPGVSPAPFIIQKNVLYKGKASVKNGQFSFSFIVPKDIRFRFGQGKLSYYAANSVSDASGFYDNVMIGGIDDKAPEDATGPEIKLYMNDPKFVFGGMTDQNPRIYAELSDSSGINTVGNGIGHDLTANLDDSKEDLFVLNDYYESDLDSYQEGKVAFPLKNLPEGRHSLKLKAWDVFNNSSESYTEFVVTSSAKLALDHVLNYPNPFTTSTSFYFEHNKPGVPLHVQVQIFTVAGKLIKTINTLQLSDGYRSEPIPWDGKDDFGDWIGKGVYVYKVKVQTPEGVVGNKFQKLVILK
jgi:hypothetical protein